MVDKIKETQVKSVMTKSSLPVGGYSVNPYVGCPHACKYCYASFMKRFANHPEPWGTFLDVKYWPKIKNPQKYKGQRGGDFNLHQVRPGAPGSGYSERAGAGDGFLVGEHAGRRVPG